jgi:hypothetical protein
MIEIKDEKKSVDPIAVATLATAAVAAYPAAKEIVRDVKKVIQNNQEEKF